MCGIFGYIGRQDVVATTISGLKRLEYRGYDSSGIAGIKNGKILFCKEVGKVAVMEKEALKLDLDLAIAQTRWATHGKPSKVNAHPHFDTNHTLAVVHNGIIENYEALRKMLPEVVFVSETDTEVIAHLIAKFYKGDLLKALGETILLLRGSYALALIHRDHPGEILAVGHESPLAIGIGKGEAFISSDPNSFNGAAYELLYLADSEVAVVRKDKVELFNAALEPISKATEKLIQESQEVSKGTYAHYTLKEIHEQPLTIENALLDRFASLEWVPEAGIERVLILACGSSYHAGCIASYMMEGLAKLPVQVEIASEFRYKDASLAPHTLVIAISQSGETADTLATVRDLKKKGQKILGICNVHGSSLARVADHTIFLRAGQEVGVASTKAFTSQLVVLSLITLLLGHLGKSFIEALKKLPEQVQSILDQELKIKAIAESYSHYNNFFFLGRQYLYPTALEGALKLKELAYVNANGYAAGEMKHGPITLIDDSCITVALLANSSTRDKMMSNLMEVKARSGKIITIDDESSTIGDSRILIPRTIDPLAPILTSVALQLFAYYFACARGVDIDQPRNLAKSVTVE